MSLTVNKKKRIAVVGFMGTGKTHVGKLIAKHLGWDFVDVDAGIVSRRGKSISRIFKEDGEASFRKTEEALTLQYLKKNNTVLSLGGGAVLSAAVRRELKKSSNCVIWVKASIRTIYERVKKNARRPLLNVENPLTEIRRIYGSRKPLYKKVADVSLVTDSSYTKERIKRLRCLKGFGNND